MALTDEEAVAAARAWVMATARPQRWSTHWTHEVVFATPSTREVAAVCRAPIGLLQYASLPQHSSLRHRSSGYHWTLQVVDWGGATTIVRVVGSARGWGLSSADALVLRRVQGSPRRWEPA